MTIELPDQRSNKPADSHRGSAFSPYDQVLRSNGGSGLWDLSHEVASLILRRYFVERNLRTLKSRLVSALKKVLKCNSVQALSVIELSIELIHLRYFGDYHRSNVEMSYLIAKATGYTAETKGN